MRVSFAQAFLAEFGVSDKERFKLMLGTGDDKNKVRLVRDKKAGVVSAQIVARGGVWFNCGHFPRFGDEAAKKEFCAASVIDKDTIEVVLPPWED